MLSFHQCRGQNRDCTSKSFDQLSQFGRSGENMMVQSRQRKRHRDGQGACLFDLGRENPRPAAPDAPFRLLGATLQGIS
jgi:hypothetical protein